MDDDQSVPPVVLLVDDDETARFLHRQALEPAGFEIVEAEDGAAALEAFAITMPDIVVLDVLMPEMDGFAVCQAIRAMPRGRNTPILMATGLDDVSSINRAYLVGATDFIVKPISCLVLPHKIRYMLRAYHLAEAERIAGLGNFLWMPRSPLIECSSEMLSVFGMGNSPAPQSVRTLLRHVFSTDRAMLIRAVRGAFEGSRIQLDHRIVTPLGEVRTLSLRAEVVGADGAPRYLQGSYQDITARKRIECELMTARDEAQAGNAAKSKFLADMIHELHGPLNAILNCSELITNQVFGPIYEHRYIELAKKIWTSGHGILSILIHGSTIAQLEAERFELTFERLDLCEVARSTLAEFEQRDWGVDKEVFFETDGEQLTVDADRRAVQQMLLKLLSNTVLFSPARTAIRVSVTRTDNGYLRVSIADTGIGTTAAEAGTGVRPFGQIDGGFPTGSGGEGLGVSIVSKLIEYHGGRLTVVSLPQKGTQISLDFPAARLTEKISGSRNAADISNSLSGGERTAPDTTITIDQHLESATSILSVQ